MGVEVNNETLFHISDLGWIVTGNSCPALAGCSSRVPEGFTEGRRVEHEHV